LSFDVATFSDIARQLPSGVKMLAAVKTRTPEECEQAISSGLDLLGVNYFQEGLALRKAVTLPASWHFIGALQTNKLKAIVENFDLIQTVGREKEIIEIDKRAAEFGKIMPVLIEVNSAKEENKHGVFPEEVLSLMTHLKKYPHIEIRGLMTMGPAEGDAEAMRPYFQLTKKIFDQLEGLSQDNLKPTVLSMGMSDSWKVAIEEGSTLIRLGTILFGARVKTSEDLK
jgi:hypothetical protein